MYAVFVTGGKQYKVSVDDELFIEKLELDPEATVTFDQVLLIADEENLKTGTPYVNGAKVEAKVVKNGKAKKIQIFKMKAKKGYRRRQGHRQPYTKIKITAING